MNANLSIVTANTEAKKARVGSQAGDHVLFAVTTNDFQASFDALVSRGVQFRSQPETQTWGTGAIFEDLYGNRLDLVQVHSIGRLAVDMV